MKKEIVNEGFAVAQQFLQGNLKKVSIDITVLQKILDDDFARDLFVIAFNDEIEQSKKIATGEINASLVRWHYVSPGKLSWSNLFFSKLLILR